MSTASANWTISDVKNVLYPTDFSRHSEHTLPYVLAFAKDLGATVHVVHVVDTSLHLETQPYEMTAERRPGFSMQDEVEAKVHELAESAKSAGVKAEAHWRSGDVRDELLHLVNALDIGLVVMSTHAFDKPDLVALGSKYLETMRDADVPVLAIKHPEHEFVLEAEARLAIGRILCPCDLTSFSHQAVPIAADLCRRYDAELVLAHLAHTYEEYLALEGLAGKPAAKVDTYEVLDHLVEAHPDVSSRVVVVKGQPVKELPSICKNENVDLVVIATHGRKPLVRMIVGGVAERLIIDSPCPIMTVRPELIAKRFSA